MKDETRFDHDARSWITTMVIVLCIGLMIIISAEVLEVPRWLCVVAGFFLQPFLSFLKGLIKPVLDTDSVLEDPRFLNPPPTRRQEWINSTDFRDLWEGNDKGSGK